MEDDEYRSATARVGRRVMVMGIAGAGKSTFARALSAKTSLPVIHLDVHYWRPSWVAPAEDEWREQQRLLLASDGWIVDGNDLATVDLRLERADTVVFLDTARWLCAFRALMRGIRRRPAHFRLPAGCEELAWRRLRDEWRLAWRIWRSHQSEREQTLGILSTGGRPMALHVLRSKRGVRTFLGAVAP